MKTNLIIVLLKLMTPLPDSIPRVVGEEVEGWVKVQRLSLGGQQMGQEEEEEEEEGYIPLAFTQPV